MGRRTGSFDDPSLKKTSVVQRVFIQHQLVHSVRQIALQLFTVSAATGLSKDNQAVNLDSDLSAGVRLGFQPGGLRLFCQCLSSCLSSLERMSSLDPLRRNFYADSKADALMMQSASSTSISVHLQCNFNMWIPTFQCHNVFLL